MWRGVGERRGFFSSHVRCGECTVQSTVSLSAWTADKWTFDASFFFSCWSGTQFKIVG
jgi:hypothetical protein